MIFFLFFFFPPSPASSERPESPTTAENPGLAATLSIDTAHEAQVKKRISELKQQGKWSSTRLPKLAEPSRHKMHWDYLLEEMEWLSNDFRMERKWKVALARKTVRNIKVSKSRKKNKMKKE